MKYAFVLITLLSFLHCSKAQTRSPLCFEQESIDIGRVYMNDKSFAAFPFKNCSNETVIIERVVYRGERGKNVFNIPYGREVDTIPPHKRDTIKFWKRASNDFEPGPKKDVFAVRILGSNTVQELNIFSFVERNEGRLSAQPIQIPTVVRGEKVVFNSRIRNYGNDPVTIKIFPTYSKFLKRIDNVTSPAIIAPGQDLLLTYELETKELLKRYSGSLSFETNEQGRYPRLTIDYEGELISHDHPSIKFDSLLLHKYVDQSGDGNFEFWFENDGEAPLIIRSAKTSCGCMVASYSREPIAPGERSVIKVKYDTKRIGTINKSITVITNIGEMPIILRVKGMVYPKEE